MAECLYVAFVESLKVPVDNPVTFDAGTAGTGKGYLVFVIKYLWLFGIQANLERQKQPRVVSVVGWRDMSNCLWARNTSSTRPGKQFGEFVL